MRTGTRRRERLLLAVAAGPLLVAAVVVGFSPSRPLPAVTPPVAVTRARPLPIVLEAVEREQALRTLLEARGEAVLHHDRAAFLATVDPAAKAFRARQGALLDALTRLPLSSWTYAAEPSAEPLRTAELDRRRGTWWGQNVSLRYQLAGFDAEPALRRQYLTFVRRSGRWYVAADDEFAALGLTTERDLWDDGPVVLARRPGVLVLGHPGAASRLAALARDTERAIHRVTEVWGTGWSQRVVVVVPAAQAELARLVPHTGDLSQIAALATAGLEHPGTGYHPVGDRILVNPPVFARLGDLGRRVVLAHEVTHVASRAASGASVPTWLVEGLADYVGYGDVDVPLSVSARELQVDVRAGRVPRHLPTEAAYAGADLRLAQAYEQSWRAVSLIAERYGQARMLQLYRDVGRDDRPGALARALRRDLHLSLTQLTAAWREQLRRELG